MEQLINAINEHRTEVEQLLAAQPDWQTACKRFDALFGRMCNPKDQQWSAEIFATFKEVYFARRDKDKGMSNIVVRTLSGLPTDYHNDAKILFLQIAEVCSFFNASHKVNFDASELPEGYDGIRMVPAKTKGVFTFADPTPSLYKKTSLTFDYWVPKFIDWTDEVRSKGLKNWKGTAIFEHESCTDFMRVCLLFLSDTANHVPIAKAEDREAFLKLLGENFVWIKKSAKREDIAGNSQKLKSGLEKVANASGLNIPPEAWSRLQQAAFVKSILK